MRARNHGSGQARLVARIVAVGALVLFWTTLYVLVTQGGVGPATASGSDAVGRLEAIARPSAELARRLERLRPGRRARPVRDAIVETMEARGAAQKWLEAAVASGEEIDEAEKLANALERHREYLDALGSVVSNPLSPHRFRMAVVAARARSAYGSLSADAGLAATIRGSERALSYSAWRRESRRGRGRR